ncbi:MAG: hypothetical protein OXR82_08950 [Gammaproteobacteria bacterium]|nr:hypothetical protein [Gammaproteobacteria bacterium]MDE0258494.1 hypothetical protein [Gammaproteobacteria bacterium]
MSITLRPVYHAADPPPPDKTFTPERMADLAKGLERAIARIEAWGIDVQGGSRLRNTVKLLQEVASAGEFPEPREDLLKIAQAAVDAQEFIIIRGMLPQERLDPTANILKKAVGGTIGVTPHEAYQAQSELWVGAALSCASVPLGVLTNPQGPNPDYIVRKGTLRYAIEVKRIAEGKSVKNRVSKAAKQTRDSRYHGSALYVDLTDWLPSAITVRFASGPPDLEGPRTPIAKRIDRLRQEIYSDQSHRIRPRRLHLLAVTAFARFIHWDLTDLSQMHLARYVAPLWFWRGAKTLRYHRARWLAELLPSAAGNIGLQHLGAHEISFHNQVS